MKNKKGENRKSSHCNFFPKNSKGQELSTNTIILIILAIAVLVVLVLGFTIGWSKVLPWLNSDNIETIVNQCQTACTTSATYAYCSQVRTLKASDLPKDATGKIQKEVENTCKFFSEDKDYTKYAIGQCPGLCPEETPTTESPAAE
jgi:hypothetical protein